MSVDIAAENTLPGAPASALAITGAGSTTVMGFTRDPSTNVGGTVSFSCTGTGTTISIYRMGWYGGDGWRLVDTIPNTPTSQPEATVIPGSNGATTCTHWTTTATWDVPTGATSGMYVGVLHDEAGERFWVPFTVRDDDAQADIIYKTSESTWGAAYNNFGTITDPASGRNLYGRGVAVGNIMDRCLATSYHRPIITRQTGAQTYFMACEAPLIRFLERNGYRVKYVTSLDLDQDPGLIEGGTIFLSSGHDEYWSQPMRDAVETWRDTKAGRSVFMSGNEVFWRTRYERNDDEPIMWCYKDTMPGPAEEWGRHAGEPFDPVTWTGTWMDTRWPDHRDGALLTGTKFGMNGIYDYDAVIPQNPYGGYKVWGGSALVDRPVTLQRVIGFEADHLHPTQPEESARILAAYTRSAPGGLSDENGEVYTVPGSIEWGIISQRYASGAVTVGFGTCQWSWALDGTHDRGTGAEVSTDAQQFTVNLLRDLGADPVTLMAGLALQPRSPLDEYGAIPAGTTPPASSGFQLADGTQVHPMTILDGNAVPLHV